MKKELAKSFLSLKTAIKKHSPEILTGIGIAGMITTTVMAVRATPKALILIEERKEEIGAEKLEAMDMVKTAWACYIPAAITGTLSVACLIGASSVNARRNAALATAYATPEIIQFVMDYGKRYGYTFEHEATYDRMCLVNDAVYIAKYKDGKWTATGTQFQIPYVFKKLFSGEEIVFEDMCETKSVSSALYLDMNEGLPDVSEYEKEFSKAESDYRKGLLSDTTFEKTCQSLNPKIAEGHNYIFIGRVGQFCPIKPGAGGGLLMREKDGRYYAATGSKGYRWLESEMVKELSKEDSIDRSYYDKLVDDAVETISKYGDFEWFVSDDPYIPKPRLEDFMNIPEDADEELPFN